ncbi:hypothetical protein D917_10416 [Trichinella nativa]|uniref:Uncharacterized protein n=1 Tax=Trichinella nativa TaxID=6335 RepID=A0A1Y3EAJ2_9BILA|nr:hypothetical protein D917_10416 [Trichinella nativa]
MGHSVVIGQRHWIQNQRPKDKTKGFFHRQFKYDTLHNYCKCGQFVKGEDQQENHAEYHPNNAFIYARCGVDFLSKSEMLEHDNCFVRNGADLVGVTISVQRAQSVIRARTFQILCPEDHYRAI